MKRKRHNKGFTLLEIIIVIIIIGVLAALALPRLFTVVEGSRAVEALIAIASIRSSMERCYIMNNESYENCDLRYRGPNSLDIEDPAESPNAHFTYFVRGEPPTYQGGWYCILVNRNARDGGTAYLDHKIFMGYRIVPDVYDINQARFDSYSDEEKFHWDASPIYKPRIPR